MSRSASGSPGRPSRLPTYRDLGRLLSGPVAFRRAMNLWPPFLFSSIRIDDISPDWRHVRTSLRRTPLTANYLGTLYGGSLFSMTDPFWMMMVLHNLGDDWVVWDKAAEIEFVSPGRGSVSTEFRLTDRDVDAIRAEAAVAGKALRWFSNDILAADGTLVARVRKQVYARPRTPR